MKRRILAAGGLLIASASLVAAGCGSSSSTDTAASGGGEAPAGAAVGSGASFPATAYTKWCQESETCTYASKGSGAGIKDLTAGTYRQLVEAAESCQVAIIHPGKPRDPNEAGLEELLVRAEPFR